MTSKDDSNEGGESEEEGHNHDGEEGGGDQDDHDPRGNYGVTFPRAGKVWLGGPPSLKYGYEQIYVPDDCPKGGVARSRYKTFGKAAMMHGLKYDPQEDRFSARLVYTV
jgi:hypothetical protein